MRGRRAVQAENRALQQRLSECQALLAGAAIAAGGSLIVTAASLDTVAAEADTRTLAVKVLITGNMRVDFLAPEPSEIEIRVVGEEAPCLST